MRAARAGIPLIGFLILFVNRRDFGRSAFVNAYGFIFKGYEQQVPQIYWEVTFVMGRKVGFVFLTVYLATSTVLTQTYTAVFFIFVCIVAHTWFKPYAHCAHACDPPRPRAQASR